MEDDVFFNVWKECKTLYWKTGFKEPVEAAAAAAAEPVEAAQEAITFYFPPPIDNMSLDDEFLELLQPYTPLPSFIYK